MKFPSELRCAGYHMVGIVLLLALYCGFVGEDAVGVRFVSAGVVMLAGLAAVGGGTRKPRLDDEEADDIEYFEFDTLKQPGQW
jgi:hypothetical protein